MRIPDELRECVCFVRTIPNNETGSAVLIGVPLGLTGHIETDKIAVYAVTARHCIIKPGAKLASQVWLFTNRGNGSAIPIQTDPAAWILHESADVAAYFVGFGLDAFDLKVKFYSVDEVATSEYVEQEQIGPGDEVFVVGQLNGFPSSQVMPIVRLGSVAAIPDEPLALKTGTDTVTLLEMRSIGGLSGSPVFVHMPFWRDAPAGLVLTGNGGKAMSGGTHRLLGIMHGFYSIGSNDPDGISGDENLNTGIAIITRVDRMLDLINSAAQMQIRAAMKRTCQGSQVSVPADPVGSSGGQ